MIQVIERKTVPANCSTCLYGPNAVGWDGKPVGRIGCAHADRQNDWMLYGMGLKGPCPSDIHLRKMRNVHEKHK